MTLSEQADSLPLLDRAKFFVTISYTIDSLIFCTPSLLKTFFNEVAFLRTKGANYKDHPIMQELERVRAYTRKMNTADQVPTERMSSLENDTYWIGNMVVDREAAQRMILHGIPKSQIVPDPNARPTSLNSGQKRASPESDRLQQGNRSKKKKTARMLATSHAS
jgi:exosome complex protein LRP1